MNMRICNVAGLPKLMAGLRLHRSSASISCLLQAGVRGRTIKLQPQRSLVNITNHYFKVSEEVREAIENHQPVVALETTIYTHGRYQRSLWCAPSFTNVIRFPLSRKHGFGFPLGICGPRQWRRSSYHRRTEWHCSCGVFGRGADRTNRDGRQTRDQKSFKAGSGPYTRIGIFQISSQLHTTWGASLTWRARGG